MTDQHPKNTRNDQDDESLEEVDAEVVEDLDVEGDAEDVEGGRTTISTVCGITQFGCATQ